jgi:hypothetical protein
MGLGEADYQKRSDKKTYVFAQGRERDLSGCNLRLFGQGGKGLRGKKFIKIFISPERSHSENEVFKFRSKKKSFRLLPLPHLCLFKCRLKMFPMFCQRIGRLAKK